MMLFYVVWSLWFISEILLNRILRAKKSDKQGVDKGSIRMIWITIGIANTVGILSAIFLKLPISSFPYTAYLGLAIILLGMIIRLIAVWSLGRYFTVDVTIREDHRIKKNGMYKLIRHPSYLGSILSFIGFGVSLNNWISLVVITVLIIWAMFHRIAIEEKALVDEFGKEYREYMGSTYRLIPWIY